RPDGMTVGEIGAGEPLRGLPALAYPAQITVGRKASRSALVAFDGNGYSVPPAHAGRTVTVLTRVGEPNVRIVSAAGEIIASHRRAPTGRRADDPDHRARRHAGESGPRGVHDRTCVPAEGEPAARPARSGRAREAHRTRAAAEAGGQPRRLPAARRRDRRRGRSGAMSGTDTPYQQLREHLHTLGLTAAAD